MPARLVRLARPAMLARPGRSASQISLVSQGSRKSKKSVPNFHSYVKVVILGNLCGGGGTFRTTQGTYLSTKRLALVGSGAYLSRKRLVWTAWERISQEKLMKNMSKYCFSPKKKMKIHQFSILLFWAKFWNLALMRNLGLEASLQISSWLFGWYPAGCLAGYHP